ncbi:MAG TPA: 3-isopropylmalate dehydratase small subunit [bacterium]|nr:3-isopropylmalate dehydratase small subunit [bacterium]
MAMRGTAHKLGHHVDTDVIIPARYLVTNDPAELARYCFEDLDPTLRARIRPGDIIVAGENFGQGSSREHAPIAIKALGIPCIVASSFARIFYRNAFNIGLPLVESADAYAGIEEGHDIEVDLSAGRVDNHSTAATFISAPVPDFMQRLLDAGGIVGYARMQLAQRKR